MFLIKCIYLTMFMLSQMKIRQCWARICNTWVRSATIEQIEQRSWALSLCDRPHSSSHSLPARLDTCAARCSVPPTVTFSPADIFLENHECISVYLLFYDSKGLWCLDMMTHASYGLDMPAQATLPLCACSDLNIFRQDWLGWAGHWRPFLLS